MNLKMLSSFALLLFTACGDTIYITEEDTPDATDGDAQTFDAGTPDSRPLTDAGPERGIYAFVFTEASDSCGLPVRTSKQYEMVPVANDIIQMEPIPASDDRWLCTVLSRTSWRTHCNQNGEDLTYSNLENGGILYKNVNMEGFWLDPVHFSGESTVSFGCTGFGCESDCAALGIICPCVQSHTFDAHKVD